MSTVPTTDAATAIARHLSGPAGLPQWVCWSWAERDGQQTKLPVNPKTGELAETNDPSSWTTLSEALAAYKSDGGYSGVGFVFEDTDPYMGIDLDHCLNTDGTVKKWARPIVKALSVTYGEISPSGTGLKFFGRGKIPLGRRLKRWLGEDGTKEAVEMFDDGRYFTVTGRHFPGTATTVEDCRETVAKLHSDLFPKEHPVPSRKRTAGGSDPGDSEVIDKVTTDPHYAKLWRGEINGYPSQSEADLALAGRIGFFVGWNENRMEQVFDRSGLAEREKWDRKDYRDRTIARARAGKSECFDWRPKAANGKHHHAVDQPDGDRQDRGDYVLVPGKHVTDQSEEIERGADGFSDEAVSRLKPGSVYRRVGVAGQIVGDSGARLFKPLDTDPARILIDGAMRLGRWRQVGGGENERQTLQFLACSRDTAGLVLARAATDPRVPELRHLTPYPIFLPGFELCRPGFHAGVYYDEPDELRGLTPETDPDVIRDALDDLTVDFPFGDSSSRQNFIGLLLTPVIRPALSGNTPGHLIHASLERTGKTKLAEEGFGGVVTGAKTPAMQLAEDNTEMDKRITAILLRGGTILHLDNLKEWIDLPCLASLLTASTYQGRLLGSSTILDIPNNLTIVATGNNVRATGELVKRMVPICLQPKSDAPELRTDFKHPDFWGYVRKHRRLVLSCLVGMVQTWVKQGKPRGRQPMGGFDEWAATVGGILDLFGYSDWLGNASGWRDSADWRRTDLRALVEVWHKRHQGGPLTVAEILSVAQELELFPDVIDGKREGKALQTSFGMKVLARNADTPVRIQGTEGSWVIRRNTLSRPAIYSLQPLKDDVSQ